MAATTEARMGVHQPFRFRPATGRCRSLTSGREGSYESLSNGWWAITWDGSADPVETWAPLTRSLVEIVEDSERS